MASLLYRNLASADVLAPCHAAHVAVLRTGDERATARQPVGDDEGIGSSPRPFSTNQVWKAFSCEWRKHSTFDGARSHGLRVNEVIRLRLDEYFARQVSDMVGMSDEMVAHYSCNADNRAGGQAILREFQEREPDEL